MEVLFDLVERLLERGVKGLVVDQVTVVDWHTKLDCRGWLHIFVLILIVFVVIVILEAIFTMDGIIQAFVPVVPTHFAVIVIVVAHHGQVINVVNL
jgi:hypothetical protein